MDGCLRFHCSATSGREQKKNLRMLTYIYTRKRNNREREEQAEGKINSQILYQDKFKLGKTENAHLLNVDMTVMRIQRKKIVKKKWKKEFEENSMVPKGNHDKETESTLL